MSDTFHMGGCGCGRVRYRMLADPLIVHACHCRMCQRLTGSTHAVNALIEADKLILLSGETFDRLALTPSGHGQNISRCACCHVAVWSEYLIFAQRRGVSLRFVRAGTLDYPERFPPDVDIYTSSRQAHAADRPDFEQFYEIGRVWPADSLSRLKRLSNAPAAVN